MVLDIMEGYIYARSQKKTKIVNIYDNKVGKRQIWQGSELRIQQAIKDFSWQAIIKRQILIVGDINTYSRV